jgi:hypothetical protein
LLGLPHRLRPHSRRMTDQWRERRSDSFRKGYAYKVAPHAASTSFHVYLTRPRRRKTVLLDLFMLGTGMTRKGSIAQPLPHSYCSPCPEHTQSITPSIQSHLTLLHIHKSAGRPSRQTLTLPLPSTPKRLFANASMISCCSRGCATKCFRW